MPYFTNVSWGIRTELILRMIGFFKYAFQHFFLVVQFLTADKSSDKKTPKISALFETLMFLGQAKSLFQSNACKNLTFSISKTQNWNMIDKIYAFLTHGKTTLWFKPGKQFQHWKVNYYSDYSNYFTIKSEG